MLSLVAEGGGNREVAHELWIIARAVKTQVGMPVEKCRSAVRAATQERLLEPRQGERR